MKILLVEDSPVNRLVAVRLLEKNGYQVIVAVNGREAIEKLDQEKVDMALMDVQMPEMDGFEATRLIRAKETKTARHLPIVAMTAHAMKGDRERCLEAGMDDYLTKPIRTPELLAMLLRYEPETAKQTSALHAAAASAINSDESAERLWSVEQALERVGGDRDLLAEVIALFEAECPKHLDEIRASLDRSDAKTLERAAHTLKGAASNFFAESVTNAARELEMLGRVGDLSRARAAFQRVEKETKGLLQDLGAYCRKVAS